RRRIQTQVSIRLPGSMTLVADSLKNRLNVADEIDGGLRLGGILGGHGRRQRRGDGRNRETRKGTSPHRAAPDRRSGEREGNTVLAEGLRPSDSPTRGLARRFDGSLPPPLKLRRTRRSLGEGGPVAWLARDSVVRRRDS